MPTPPPPVSAPAGPMPPSRLSPLSQEQFTDKQRALLVELFGAGATPPIPFYVWAHNTELGRWVENLGAYCRTETRFDDRLRQLSMVIAARHFDSAFVWNAHYTKLIGLGMPVECLDRIARHEDPQFPDRAEQLFFTFATELLTTHFVQDEIFAAALNEFGEQALLDLIGCLGSFTISSLTMNAFRVKRSLDEAAPFDDIADFQRVSDHGD